MKHYRMKCDHCGHIFVTHYKGSSCPRHVQRHSSSTFVEDVLETAVDVATTYVALDVAGDVLSGVGELIGSLFD